jgi:hypothetical protein
MTRSPVVRQDERRKKEPTAYATVTGKRDPKRTDRRQPAREPVQQWREEFNARRQPAEGVTDENAQDYITSLITRAEAAEALAAQRGELLKRIRASINTDGELSALCMQDIDATLEAR